MNLTIINTSDGSKTIYIPEMEEQYHSVNGAITESKHVFLESGFHFHKSETPVVFEVGFGTGLNCLLTALAAINTKRPTTFYTLEKYPLKRELIDQLDYGRLISKEARDIFKDIHECDWEQNARISEYFTLKKIQADLKTWKADEIRSCDIIYFDAFGPNKQANMWKPKIFEKMYSISSLGGIFVTYSAKGEVRRNLASVGYQMERIPGPPGKIQMLRGIKY